jgi:hypothetical protein
MPKKEGNECTNPIHELEKHLKMSDIPLWLDRYDDIFSEFDSRHYSQRALSTDFLFEAKKASRDKETGKIELKLFMPKAKRNLEEEEVIIRRLKNHFKKHYNLVHSEQHAMFNRGMMFTIIGIVMMFAASLIIFKTYEKSLWISFIIVMLEPAGWFLFWEGLNQALFESKHLKSKLDFYKKMAECKISFWSY